MFNSFDHFKKATSDLLKEIKAKPSMKLNEFRELLVKKTDYGNQDSFKNSFSNEENSFTTDKEQFLHLILNNTFLIADKNVFVDACYIENEYLDILYTDEDGEQHFFKIHKDDLNFLYLGDSYFYVFEDDEFALKIRVFIPFDNSQKYNFNIDENPYILIEDQYQNHEIVILNEKNESDIYDLFVSLLSTKISNFDEYSSDDLQSCFENRKENYGAGTISILNY